MKLRRLNAEGKKAFVDLIATMKQEPTPNNSASELACDEALTEIMDHSAELSMKSFASRFDMALHIHDVLASIPQPKLMGDDGLWNWLALSYFDQICGKDKNGNWKPDAQANYVRDLGFLRYRHSVYLPWWLVGKYEQKARFLLSKEPSTRGEVIEQLTSVQYYPSCEGVMMAARELYWDHEAECLKKGSGGAGPGSPRRFQAVLSQVEINYDLFSIDKEVVLDLLPREFDRFK
jgi:hypothetical protein